MYDILELNKKLLPELREIAKELEIKRVESFKKQDLVYKILDTQAIKEAEKKERKNSTNEQKDDKGLKNFIRKKSSEVVNQAETDDDQREKRPRRERMEPIVKHEKVETGKRKQQQQRESSPVQSRQEQIKAIIKGFNRDKVTNTNDETISSGPEKKSKSLWEQPKKEKKPAIEKQEVKQQNQNIKTQKEVVQKKRVVEELPAEEEPDVATKRGKTET